MSDPNERPPGNRPKIGHIDGDPVTSHPKLDTLSENQRALRLAVIKEFKAKKVKKFVEKQVQHINTNQRIAEGIKFLFDEEGRPPPNMPMEDIIAERRHIEYEIRWFEAILEELHNRLVRVKEIEDHALDMLADRFTEE
ncbi:hypothetical protein LRH25_23205 [Ideonella azotifigens]|uniref:HNH nuclease domain-containing protein n=1 Tax=Ideonella azotifigens TaxID=513160 RepID=A0ABN1JWK8_9BURK|nr:MULTISPECIES: hypothetical protein [Ideonella]MCD2343237.1 hypothetical protein [Ideonella azotifigens]HSI47230.1 hypothetical protein [Ideonella sp.]